MCEHPPYRGIGGIFVARSCLLCCAKLSCRGLTTGTFLFDRRAHRRLQVQRYVESMAKRTMENTYRAGRTEPNIPDVLQGFQQLVRIERQPRPTAYRIGGDVSNMTRAHY